MMTNMIVGLRRKEAEEKKAKLHALAASKYKTMPKPVDAADTDEQPPDKLQLGRSVSEGAKNLHLKTDGKFMLKMILPATIVALIPGGQTRHFILPIVEHNRFWTPSRVLDWVDEELTSKYRIVTDLEGFQFSPVFKNLAELQLKGILQVSIIPEEVSGTTSSTSAISTSPTTSSTSAISTSPTTSSTTSSLPIDSTTSVKTVDPATVGSPTTPAPPKLLVQGLASRYRDSVKSVGR